MFTVCIQCLWRPKEVIRCPGTGDTGSCDLPCESWDPNPGPLEEQPVFLTRAITAAPSLASTFMYHIVKQDKNQDFQTLGQNRKTLFHLAHNPERTALKPWSERHPWSTHASKALVKTGC